MNRYKPRYKIAFQSKNKIWPYKNSRLRRFFNIRGRKLVRRGYFKFYVLVLNSMKWTIARRYIRPYMRRRKAVRRRFRDAFYRKQQLKAFHGKIKEHAFRKNFQKYLVSGVNRNKSFFSSLERRLDIFFFRMRLLPTIFACNQYILQHGILINEGVNKSPNALLNVGDIVSFNYAHWNAFYSYFRQRLTHRYWGKCVNLRRKFLLLKKKAWKIRSVLRYRKYSFFLRKKRLFLNLLILKFTKKFMNFYKIFSAVCKKIIEKIFHKNFNEKVLGTKFTKKEWKVKWTNFLLNIYRSRKNFLEKFNQFIQLEKHRNKLFHILIWQKWKLFYYLKQDKKKKKQAYFFQSGNEIWQDYRKKALQKKGFLILKTSLNPKIQFMINNVTKKESTSNIFLIKEKLIHNQYMKLVFYSLRMLFKSYLNWLKIKYQFKVEEMYSHFFLLYFLSFFNSKNIDFNKLLNLIEQRELLMKYKVIDWRNKLTTYYNLFFYRYIQERRIKLFYKYLLKRKRKIFKGNLLTYFLIRHRQRANRAKRIPRLKRLHWAIPSYMHFDPCTLRAVLLSQPMPKQIHYAFKCSMESVASFYKSLAV